MADASEIRKRVLNLAHHPGDFDATAMEVFDYQYENNPLYRRYCQLIGKEKGVVNSIKEIPCLPISLFKSREVKTEVWDAEKVFLSSGTGGQIRAKHCLRSEVWYSKIARTCFESVYGPLEDYNWLGLLPNYLEQGESSLVHMVQEFVRDSEPSCSGIFSAPDSVFFETLAHAEQSQRKTILIGVSFALLDLAEKHDLKLGRNFFVMETGGMKGRRKEMIRPELHEILKRGLSVETVHSEYGMTELLSQAYSTGGGVFEPGPGLRIYTRELNDPFAIERVGVTGCVNVIDLANIDSCSFIMTMDMGRMVNEKRFEILGRQDGSDIRGCNLMYGDR
jgi:hypothetical protein